MKIIITGGNGYIAQSIFDQLKDEHEITLITRKDVNLLDSISVSNWFSNKIYDVLIHTAITGGSRLSNDDKNVFEQNLIMYENIFKVRKHFNKFISFGSGAEIFSPNSYYGKSKVKICESINQTDNFYNLRIFGVFDYNEIDTRFIKGNIIKYLKKEPILIHANKIMDFIYMKDLIKIINYYLLNDNLPKIINCSYENKYTLKYIASFINNLHNYEVPVIIENKETLQYYCGNSHGLPINEIGLEQGIIDTYNILKEKFLL